MSQYDNAPLIQHSWSRLVLSIVDLHTDDLQVAPPHGASGTLLQKARINLLCSETETLPGNNVPPAEVGRRVP